MLLVKEKGSWFILCLMFVIKSKIVKDDRFVRKASEAPCVCNGPPLSVNKNKYAKNNINQSSGENKL